MFLSAVTKARPLLDRVRKEKEKEKEEEEEGEKRKSCVFQQAELLPPVPLEFAACVFSAYFAGRNKRKNAGTKERKKEKEEEARAQADVK